MEKDERKQCVFNVENNEAPGLKKTNKQNPKTIEFSNILLIIQLYLAVRKSETADGL